MNIIIATDFSEYNENLFPYAINLLGKAGGKVLLFHSYSDHILLGDPGLPGMVESDALLNTELLAELEAKAQLQMQEKVDRLKHFIESKALQNITIESVVKGGEPETALAELITDIKADLILLGTRGKGKKGFLEGSTARRIMEKISTPLLVVPEGYTYRENNRVLYATSFNKDDEAAIELILELLEPYDPEVHVVHLWWDLRKQEPVLRIEALRQTFIKEVELGKVKFSLLPARNTRDDLMTYCAANDISMLSFIANKRSWLDYLFPAKVSKNDFFSLGLPMLTFRFDKDLRP